MVPAGFRALFEKNKVSVLIPTYNNAQTLSNVVSTVLEYTDQVIVVNDGSTDSTLQLLSHFHMRCVKVFNVHARQGTITSLVLIRMDNIMPGTCLCF